MSASVKYVMDVICATTVTGAISATNLTHVLCVTIVTGVTNVMDVCLWMGVILSAITGTLLKIKGRKKMGILTDPAGPFRGNALIAAIGVSTIGAAPTLVAQDILYPEERVDSVILQAPNAHFSPSGAVFVEATERIAVGRDITRLHRMRSTDVFEHPFLHKTDNIMHHKDFPEINIEINQANYIGSENNVDGFSKWPDPVNSPLVNTNYKSYISLNGRGYVRNAGREDEGGWIATNRIGQKDYDIEVWKKADKFGDPTKRIVHASDGRIYSTLVDDGRTAEYDIDNYINADIRVYTPDQRMHERGESISDFYSVATDPYYPFYSGKDYFERADDSAHDYIYRAKPESGTTRAVIRVIQKEPYYWASPLPITDFCAPTEYNANYFPGLLRINEDVDSPVKARETWWFGWPLNLSYQYLDLSVRSTNYSSLTKWGKVIYAGEQMYGIDPDSTYSVKFYGETDPARLDYNVPVEKGIRYLHGDAGAVDFDNLFMMRNGTGSGLVGTRYGRALNYYSRYWYGFLAGDDLSGFDMFESWRDSSFYVIDTIADETLLPMLYASESYSEAYYGSNGSNCSLIQISEHNYGVSRKTLPYYSELYFRSQPRLIMSGILESPEKYYGVTWNTSGKPVILKTLTYATNDDWAKSNKKFITDSTEFRNVDEYLYQNISGDFKEYREMAHKFLAIKLNSGLYSTHLITSAKLEYNMSSYFSTVNFNTVPQNHSGNRVICTLRESLEDPANPGTFLDEPGSIVATSITKMSFMRFFQAHGYGSEFTFDNNALVDNLGSLLWVVFEFTEVPIFSTGQLFQRVYRVENSSTVSNQYNPPTTFLSNSGTSWAKEDLVYVAGTLGMISMYIKYSRRNSLVNQEVTKMINGKTCIGLVVIGEKNDPGNNTYDVTLRDSIDFDTSNVVATPVIEMVENLNIYTDIIWLRWPRPGSSDMTSYLTGDASLDLHPSLSVDIKGTHFFATRNIANERILNYKNNEDVYIDTRDEASDLIRYHIPPVWMPKGANIVAENSGYFYIGFQSRDCGISPSSTVYYVTADDVIIQEDCFECDACDYCNSCDGCNAGCNLWEDSLTECLKCNVASDWEPWRETLTTGNIEVGVDMLTVVGTRATNQDIIASIWCEATYITGYEEQGGRLAIPKSIARWKTYRFTTWGPVAYGSQQYPPYYISNLYSKFGDLVPSKHLELGLCYDNFDGLWRSFGIWETIEMEP